MKKGYGKMLDDAFDVYYDKFKLHNALSPETAVDRSELFPDGESLIDRDRMHKMLSMEIVKRAKGGKLWLDEKRANDPGAVLRQRIIIIVIALVIGVAYGLLSKYYNF